MQMYVQSTLLAEVYFSLLCESMRTLVHFSGLGVLLKYTISHHHKCKHPPMNMTPYNRVCIDLRFGCVISCRDLYLQGQKKMSHSLQMSHSLRIMSILHAKFYAESTNALVPSTRAPVACSLGTRAPSRALICIYDVWRRCCSLQTRILYTAVFPQYLCM